MNDDDATRQFPENPDPGPNEPRTEEPCTLDQPTLDQPGPPSAESQPTPTLLPPYLSHDPTATVTHEVPGQPFDPWALPRMPSEIPGYELLALIGRGGLGAVYRARHQEFGVEVAIKVVPYRPQASEYCALLQPVVARLARLRHPNLANTFGLDDHGDYLYLVMELIEGRPLNRLRWPAEPQPFGFREAATLAEQIARGVGCLHARGILHRDIKPGNILVDASGRPRVTDFGLAMCLAEHGGELWPEAGSIAGTPHFMSPEQARGATATFGPQLDVWALGATLHWMLTGNMLFNRPSVSELLYAVLHEEPPSLRAQRSDVPPGLEAIARRCLQRDPASRYADGTALADDLRRYLNGDLGGPPPRKRPWWAFWRK